MDRILKIKESLKQLREDASGQIIVKEAFDYVKLTPEQTEDVKKWIANVNRYAWTPIKTTDYQIIWQLIQAYGNDHIWKNLSSDRASARYFNNEQMDPVQGTFFVDTDFLIRSRGNLLSDEKKERVTSMFKKGERFSLPFYDPKDHKVGEGNHRVWLMGQKGLRSVPIKILWDL